MRLYCSLALRVQGTTPDYWADTDPRIVATVIELIEQQDAADRG